MTALITRQAAFLVFVKLLWSSHFVATLDAASYEDFKAAKPRLG